MKNISMVPENNGGKESLDMSFKEDAREIIGLELANIVSKKTPLSDPEYFQKEQERQDRIAELRQELAETDVSEEETKEEGEFIKGLNYLLDQKKILELQRDQLEKGPRTMTVESQIRDLGRQIRELEVEMGQREAA